MNLLFDNIFAKTNTQFVRKQSKLEILRKTGSYNYLDHRFIPKFTYQSQENPNLVKLKNEFDLGTVAGNGSELTQIFNLLHWVHNSVKHDGSSHNPTFKNAFDIINICKVENRGVNCRMLAIALNECYLSMGIKSRYITCMPKETNFDQCHVINMVYSTALNKWIWIDPSFDAYVMDEKENLLGVQEVRERLIKGQPLTLNAGANLNGIPSLTKENYLEDFMAGNLYRFQTPLVSEYNAETQEKGKEVTYVELLPLDGIEEQAPQKEAEVGDSKEIKFIFNKTNNPDVFWAKPE